MKSLALSIATALVCVAVSLAQVDTGKTIGNPSAPIHVDIFSDFSCPHCKVLHEEVLPLLVQNYVNPGRMYIVLREFPLGGAGHPYSREAANDATAAARIRKYMQVSDALFKNQMTWGLNGKVWEAVASVLTLSEQNKVKALAQTAEVTGEVQRDWEAGTAAQINSTPTLIVMFKGKKYPFSGVPNGPQNYYQILSQFLNSLK